MNGRHATGAAGGARTPKAAHREEQAALGAVARGERECSCPICTYRPRHAAPLGPTFPLAA